MRPSIEIRAVALAIAVAVAGLETQATAAPAKITGEPKVHLRSGPGPEHASIGILEAGQRVESGETVGSWTRVTLRDGRAGYVFKRFVVPLALGEEMAPVPDPTTVPPGTTSVESGTEGAVEEAMGTAEPAPMPTADVSAELADLRREVRGLRARLTKVPEPGTAASGTPAGGGTVASPGVLDSGHAAVSDAGIGAVLFAVFSFLVGWVFGSMFSRRRSRAQRSRLRF